MAVVAAVALLWPLDAAVFECCRGRRHGGRQAGRAVAVPTAARRHSDDTTPVVDVSSAVDAAAAPAESRR